MIKLIHPKFLEAAHRYEAAAQYWAQRFEEALPPEGYTYKPYMDNAFGNGTPIRDGNPIFNALVPETGRAVRIIQHPPAPKASFLTWKNETEQADGTPFTELVISLILTEKTEAQAVEAMKAWLADSGREKG